MTAGSADAAAFAVVADAAAVVVATAATAFAVDSRRVSATAAHANGAVSGTPGLPPPLSNDSSTLPGAESDPRGEAAVSDGAVAVAAESMRTRLRRAGASAPAADVELRCVRASRLARAPALPRVSRAVEACEDASDAPTEPVVSASAIGIEASTEPTPSATDRVLISPTARKGRLPRSADSSPDDV